MAVVSTLAFSRRVSLGLAIGALYTVLGTQSASAFDCTGVTLPSSIVICSDPELIQLAEERQTAINEARGRVGEAAWPPLWEDQKAWVRSYATTCGVPQDGPPPPLPVSAPIKACFKRAALARVTYLRSYGGSAATPSPPPTPTAATDRIGPGFNCASAVHPLAMIICADNQLARVDLAFNQAYWALLQQLPEPERQKLKAEDEDFIEETQEECEVPLTGGLSPAVWQTRDCIRREYEKQRGVWLGRLAGPASEEARRPLEQHILLERKLREAGFLPDPPIPEGVYGPITRQAIVAWQRARGRPPTGLLGEMDAVALWREGTVASTQPAEPRKPPETAPVMAAAPAVPPKSEPPSKSDKGGTGTGFAINTTGEFLTNFHVVKGCTTIRVLIAGDWQPGRVIADDERNDLAVIRARTDPPVPALKFRDGKGIRPADAVVALGFPYAGLLTKSPQVTTGAVSALSGIGDDSRVLQLTAPVQPGNSGGPLLDLSGNVVGIVTSVLNKIAVAAVTGTLPENVNFAIKGSGAREFLDANHIDYGTAQSTNKLDPADVGEMAVKSVVMVECR